MGDRTPPKRKRAWQARTIIILASTGPVLCILFLAYMHLQTSLTDWRTTNVMQANGRLMIEASRLTHVLQQERGMSVMYSGAGLSDDHKKLLSGLYARTDDVVQNQFLPALTNSRIDSEAVEAVKKALEHLPQIREDIASAGNSKAWQAGFADYTEIITHTLNASSACVKAKTDRGIGKVFGKITLYQSARVSLGSIRGTITASVSAGSSLNTVLRDQVLGHYERVIGFLDSPIRRLGDDNSGQAFLKSEQWTRFDQTMHDIVNTREFPGPDIERATDIFDIATGIVDLVYDSELRELDALNERLAQLETIDTAALRASVLWGAGGILSGLIVLAMAWSIERSKRLLIHLQGVERELLHDLEHQQLAVDKHAIVSISDINGDIIYANDRFCELSGYTSEELIGKNHRLLKSGEHDTAYFRDLWTTISRGDTWHGEIKNRAKDGTLYWVDATIVPFKDEQGKVTHYVAIRTDITDLKNAQERNRRQATRLKTATKAARLGIWEYELASDRLVWDRTMHQIYGTGLAEEGETEYPYALWRDAVHPEDLVQTEVLVREAIDGTDSFNTRFRITRRSDGEIRHIKSMATIDRDTQGNAVRMIGVNWDVTDQVTASDQIERREDEIRAILDAIPSFVYYKDNNNVILRLNRAAAESIGRPVEEIENRHTEDFFPKEDADAYLQDDLEVISSQKPKLDIVERYRTGDHQERIIHTDKIPLRNEQGEYDRLVAIATDITALKQTEESLRVAANRAMLLHRIGEISNETEAVEEAIQRVLDFTCQTLGWQMGHCYLRSPDKSDRLVPSDLWHMKDTPENVRFREVTGQANCVSGVGLIGRVLKTGRVTWVKDVCEDENYFRNRKIKDLHVHGAVALPVPVRGRIEAVLEFYSEQVLEKNDQMVETLEAVGRELGIVLEKNRASESAQKNKQRLDLALAAANQGLWDWNLKDNSTYFNDTWLTMLGYEPGELPMTIETWKQVCHPEDYTKAMDKIERYLAGETDIYRCEVRVRKKDGAWKWILDVGKVTEFDHDGTPLRMVGVHIDIDQIKADEQRIKESERRYKLAVNGSRDGIWDWDLIDNRVYYAPQWKRMLGLEPNDPVSDSPDEWTSRIDPRDIGSFMQEFDQHLSGEDDIFEVELRMIHAQGHTVWMLCRGAVVRDETGRAIRVAGSLADITAIKDAQIKLRKAAEHDRLTDLPNRELFVKRLNKSIQRAKAEPDYKFAVLFFDFDRFKVINDSLGHNVGDALLVDIAQQFRQVLRKPDTAARFGGDEFVVLLNDLEDYDEAIRASDRLLETFAQPHHLMGHEVNSTASIGLVTNNPEYETAEEMIRDADAAMYQAKAAGRAQAVIFDQAMHEKAVKQLILESDLRSAVEGKQFYLVYQPIVDLATRTLHGFEALLRWNHPTRGDISPAEFIPITEDTGLIVPIGEWVLREACRQLHQWNHTIRVDQPITLNVNLSMRQVCHPGILDTIKKAVEDTGINPSHLKLEVTESTIVDDRHDMVPLLNQIRELGIHLAMDDFGTGHSSLGNLHMLPVDILKIDQTFIKSMSDNRALAAVMQAIITLAQHLGMTTVAEGIETTEQLALLQSLDCQYGQGYYFQKPMPTEDATRYLLGIDEDTASA